ncbi:MAG: glutamate--tRNA ligase, partial [Ruminococcus sp.]|nr:glutamate--tRNA ligase [Ruminococcus sp.]
ELLYKAFGWEVPTYIHVEHIMKDKQHKLSKRDGDASFEDLMSKGYLTEAVVNYIALLGWAPKGEEEIFSLEELIKEFDIQGLSKSPAIFDPLKLKAINAKYIKALAPEEFEKYATPYIRQTVKRDTDISRICSLLQDRTEVLTDIPEKVDFLDELRDYDTALYFNKKNKIDEEKSLTALKDILPVMQGIDEADWNEENIHDKLFELIAQKEVKNAAILLPLRVALSGKASTPGGGIEISYLIGKADTLSRIEKGIELLTK